MSAHAARLPAASALSRYLRLQLRSLDAWLAARRKSAADDASLRGMSARELRDIGLDPGLARYDERSDWVRDWS